MGMVFLYYSGERESNSERAFDVKKNMPVCIFFSQMLRSPVPNAYALGGQAGMTRGFADVEVLSAPANNT